MNDTKTISSVAEFHNTFHYTIIKQLQIHSKDRCQLRVALIEEELRELKEEIENDDLVEIADALCDIQYVLSGAVLEFGLKDKFADLFDEGQRSNMSKACKTKEEAEATMKHYLENEGVESYCVETDGLFLVYRKSEIG